MATLSAEELVSEFQEWVKDHPRRMDESMFDYALRAAEFFYDVGYQYGYTDGAFDAEGQDEGFAK